MSIKECNSWGRSAAFEVRSERVVVRIWVERVAVRAVVRACKIRQYPDVSFLLC